MPGKPTNKTQAQLIAENEDLRRRLEEAEETLNAIRSGEVDAIIVSGADGEQVYTLKQAEEALRMSEEKYRQLVEEINDGVYVTDYEGVFTFANPALARIYGVANPQALLGRKILDFIAPEMRTELGQAYRSKMRAERAPEFIHTQIRRPDGTRVFIEDKPTSKVIAGKVVGSHGVVRDITERRAVEEALALEQYLLSSLLDNVPDHIYFKDRDSRFTHISKSQAKVFGLGDSTQALGKTDFDFFTEEHARRAFEAEQKIIATGQPILALEEQETWPNGRLSWVRTTKMPLHDQAGNIIGTFGISSDITERKNAEEALARSEKDFRNLVENSLVGIFRTTVKGELLFVNDSLVRILGYDSPLDLMQKGAVLLYKNPADRARVLEIVQKEGKVNNYDIDLSTKTGETRNVLLSATFEKGILTGMISDISERKHGEEALQESEAEYRNLFENSIVGISQALPDGHLIRANNAYAQMYGYANPQEMIADITTIDRLYAHPKDREEVLRVLAAKGVMEPREMMVVRRDGTHISVLVGARAITDSKGNLRFYQAEHVEITQRIQAEERIHRQLTHLLALSSIDRLIASNFDLNLSLSEILIYVTKELGVDAADILQLNPGLQMLEFGAGQGFRTNANRKAQVRLGESYAGQVALERQLVRIQAPISETDKLFLTTRMAGEGFACYFGVPLIAKGQVKGVLEVFHRHALEPDAEWIDFLNTLAGQAAIAIENSTLFESLQRSNSELSLAYDATIEGWSHALDLRDKETEGHTLRVTEATVRLARHFGLTEAELVQVRWGALLHDIGKMGVPDGILLKPGPLTDEEWVVMKKHPSFAYEMLSPISYLRLALDIPYCHHEKWDGSGYPRGLKGAQIPLVGRIFAVVDVWDALRSDRPYRSAWTEEKVREYIRASAGTHFDPQVVDVFMQMLD